MSNPIRFAICPAATIVDCRSIIVFPVIKNPRDRDHACKFLDRIFFSDKSSITLRDDLFYRNIFLYDIFLVEYLNESTILSMSECFDKNCHTLTWINNNCPSDFLCTQYVWELLFYFIFFFFFEIANFEMCFSRISLYHDFLPVVMRNRARERRVQFSHVR